MQTKNEIRKNTLRIRNQYALDKRQKLDRKIENCLFYSREYMTAKSIFIYVNYKSEVDTKGIIKNALIAKKNIYIPKIFDDEIRLVELRTIDDLIVDTFGIKSVNSKDFYNGPIDLALVPGAAFDLSGNRIGYGKGYYDRFFFSKKVAIKFGMAYNFQVVKNIPSQDFDYPLDGIVTNEGIIRIEE